MDLKRLQFIFQGPLATSEPKASRPSSFHLETLDGSPGNTLRSRSRMGSSPNAVGNLDETVEILSESPGQKNRRKTKETQEVINQEMKFNNKKRATSSLHFVKASFRLGFSFKSFKKFGWGPRGSKFWQTYHFSLSFFFPFFPHLPLLQFEAMIMRQFCHFSCCSCLIWCILSKQFNSQKSIDTQISLDKYIFL